jgi:hypothetical protein
MHNHHSRTFLHFSRRSISAAVALLLALGTAACARDALLSPDGVQPRLSAGPLGSVTPDSAVVGDTGVVLTIRGSGFNDSSYVWTTAHPMVTTTFVNDSTLTARLEGELWATGTYEVYVITDWYYWSDPYPFVVANPAPVITRMTPDWCETGRPCGTVTLEGHNFLDGVRVLWNGGDINFTRWSDTRITFQVDPYYLQWEDMVEITVLNPEPGGGLSEPATFRIGPPITLHTEGARTGTSGLQLVVYGERFSQGAVVYWNGSPRETYVHNERRVSAWIPAADLAVPGEGVVTLSTWQLAGGEPFRVGTVTVRPQPSATVTSQLTLDLPVRDLAYSPVTERLYGTVYDGPMANSVAVIDPTSGTVQDYMWIGDSPRYLALSDDGQHLWVGVDGENRVRRVNLQYGYADFEVQLDSGMVAEDLAVVPGMPNRVAVSRRNTCCSPRHEGVAVYDGYSWGGPLPSVTPGHVGSNVIEFGAKGSTLYGLDNESTDSRYRTMTVDDGGVAITATGWDLGLEFHADMVYAGGRLYTSKGWVLDTGYNDWAGYFNGVEGAVRPDLQTGRAFFLRDNDIRVSDLNSFQPLGTLPVPAMQFEHPATQRRHLVRWGADGLAWHDADQVFLLRSPLVAP